MIDDLFEQKLWKIAAQKEQKHPIREIAFLYDCTQFIVVDLTGLGPIKGIFGEWFAEIE